MIKDLPENVVEGIGVAVILDSQNSEETFWQVYLLNFKSETIFNILVRSKGYGVINEKQVNTSTLRHAIPQLEAHEFARIEAIDQQVFGLNNEYWVSYYLHDILYDKKFIFLPESIVEENMIRIPLLNKVGVMIA